MTHYDVCICGSGPAGSTTAYFLKTQLPHLSVGLLDKARFPRDKYCGDAFCAPALDILEEMGVLQDLEARGLINNTLRGGFVSPSGYSFIANDQANDSNEPKNMATRAYAIKRMICDEAMALRAREVGCDLLENAQVEDAVLDKYRGVWTLRFADKRTVTCNVLIAADGAASNLSRKLGVVTTAPDGVAARQYIKGGTHNFKADGVLLYPEYTLPGYMALFRHFDGSIDLGAYLLPGGAAKEEDIAEIYSTRIRTDPFISRALGPNFEPLERVKVASLRLGGVKQSYAERFFIVGDAAGHIDPLTGEGIHLGMIAAKILATIVKEMFQTQRFGMEFGKRYHDEWMQGFGNDFPLSSMAGKVVFRIPYLMDAVPIAATGKGQGKAATEFFGDFGAVMTGVKPKSTFLLPWVAFPMMTATFGVLYRRIMGVERNYFQEERDRIATSFDTQCLIDINVPCGTVNPNAARDDELKEMFAWKPMEGGASRRVLVAYGTEYGFSKEIAHKLCNALFASGAMEPRMVDLALYECIDFTLERLVFVVCSTAGDGDLPVRARAFYENMPNMQNVRGCLLACGDSAYPKFCEAGRILATRLQAQGVSWPGAGAFCQELDGDDISASEEWIRTVVAEAVKLVEDDDECSPLEDYLVQSARDFVGDKTQRATKAKPFHATVKSKIKLTSHPPCTWQEDKWHIVLDVSNAGDGLLDYLPGDALGVLPENDPQEVALLAKKTGLPASVLARKNLKDASQKLLKMVSSDEMNGWIADWLPQQQYGALDEAHFKDLQPRFYSISSSPVADKGEIHLCVAAVRYECNTRKTGGVASTFLIDRLQVGDTVPVFVQANPSFRAAPAAGKKLMIGPGTGVAPFRAFARDEPAATNRNVLFFGCRYGQGDYLYGKEWPSSPYQVVTAFSRDQEEKVYVQHRIVEMGKQLWDEFLSDAATQVYICGDGFKMARDVEAALVQVVMEHGSFDSHEEAIECIKRRLHLDVWVV